MRPDQVSKQMRLLHPTLGTNLLKQLTQQHFNCWQTSTKLRTADTGQCQRHSWKLPQRYAGGKTKKKNNNDNNKSSSIAKRIKSREKPLEQIEACMCECVCGKFCILIYLYVSLCVCHKCDHDELQMLHGHFCGTTANTSELANICLRPNHRVFCLPPTGRSSLFSFLWQVAMHLLLVVVLLLPFFVVL